MCALFERVGPDEPTLCAGWTTGDLLAHLVIRQWRLDAAVGIVIPALAGHTARVQRAHRRRPWPELIDMFRAGGPWWSPFRRESFSAKANLAEYIVHHEDIRRARPGWTARPAEAVRDDAVWSTTVRYGRMLYRRAPVGLRLRDTTTDRPVATVRPGPEPVTLSGAPVELLLHAYGRAAITVDIAGSQRAVAAFAATPRGV